jgi:hypothetical protein
MGLTAVQIAASVEKTEHVVRSVLAHQPIQRFQLSLQAETTLDWLKYTERFDELAQKALNIVENTLDAEGSPGKKKWAVEFVADRDPKRRMVKRTAQEVSHRHRLEGFSGEDIDELNRRGRELLAQKQPVIDVDAAEIEAPVEAQENEKGN